MIGLLVLAHPQPDAYSTSDVAQLGSFVSPVAIALENKRLRQQARSAAMLEELSRVARELHDAVTQTLFSASLIAEAMPDALERDRERAALGASEIGAQLTIESEPDAGTTLILLWQAHDGSVDRATQTATASAEQPHPGRRRPDD